MKQQGFYFIEGMPTHNGVKPGTVEPENWKPYKIWAGDLWQCEGCGAKIVSGFGREPVSEHYREDFAHYTESLNATQLQVNDC